MADGGEILRLSPGEVHLWRGSLAGGTPSAQVSGEVARNLGRVLACYLGENASPRIVRPESGKPVLEEGSSGWLRFNLSHSHGSWLIGLARDLEIGVDLERTDHPAGQRRRHDAIARRFFSDEENDWLERVGPTCARAEFFRIWVLKEALLKAAGIGITRELASFSVLDGGDGSARLKTQAGDPLRAQPSWMMDYAPAPGEQAAVAVIGASGPFRLLHFNI